MDARFTAINLTLAGLTAAAVLSFAGNTSAAPAEETPSPEPPPTAETAPTTMGPTTLPPTLDDQAVIEVTVDLTDHAPERASIVTLSGETADSVDLEPDDLEPDDLEPDDLEPIELEPDDLEPDDLEPIELEPDDREPIEPDPDGHDLDRRYELIDEAESPTRAELDPAVLPDPEYLAPCGVVPYNLAPQGPVVLVDMTGDGSANDRLSIRQIGSGSTVDYRLHLELADGMRSETHVPAFSGYLPAVGSTLQVGLESTETHPAPDADEVLVTIGEIGTSRFWNLFGTDERGCITGYTNEIGSPAGVMFRRDDWFRAGWSCALTGHLFVEQATRQSDDTWDTVSGPVVRTGPSTVERRFNSGAFGQTHPPTFGASC